jgi:hypothetical protein
VTVVGSWPGSTPMTDCFTAAHGELQLIGTEIEDVVGACRPRADSGYVEKVAGKLT